jgi:predicted  nucleic acid-binding Zn-ribbon protein
VSAPFDDLSRLADLDIALVALERSRGGLPARRALAELSERFAELERARALLEPERTPLAASLHAFEEDVAKLSERKAQVEARLDAATGAGRELEAMSGEARHLGERLRELEDQELELMEALEPLDERLAGLRAEAAPMLPERDRLLAERADEEAALDAGLAAQRLERDELAGRLEPSLFQRYEKIAAREGGAGAARLEHGSCSGCHLAVSAAEADRLRHLPVEELSTCEQCERILIRPDQLGS